MSISLKQTLLSMLLLSPSISGSELEQKTGLSRMAISKAIASLKNEGHLIESRRGNNGGYSYKGISDILNRDIINLYLKTPFGKAMDVLNAVDSTNLYLKRNLPSLKDGHAVIASSQTAGLGRKGRPFYSPNGGLYLSVLLRPSITTKDVSFLTICAAVAITDAIKEVYEFDADIKWVNDIFFGGKKLAGISTDATFSAENFSIESVVLGIGINISNTPTEVADIATDIKYITQKVGLKNKFVASILNNLHSITTSYYTDGTANIIKLYRERCFILGKHITVHEQDTTYDALADSITSTGALVVRPLKSSDKLANSKIVYAGEVSVNPII